MSSYADLIPVNIVTGFLGSGKTTLLTRVLRAPALANTAVIVNELGEIGLDHHLLGEVAESTLLLENGCICCSIRDDLKSSLRALFSSRERGEVPRFERIVIETSGLGDPAPIAYTLAAEPVLQHHFRLGSIITLVDAVNGLRHLDNHRESVKQAALADRLVLSKTDLAPAGSVQILRRRLHAVNPDAPILDHVDEVIRAEVLTEDLHGPGQGREAVVRTLLALQPRESDRDPDLDPDLDPGLDPISGHASDVTSFVMTLEGSVDWTAFGIWLSMILNRHGERILRVKGFLNVMGQPGPVLLNGVNHIVHPPTHLDRWPSADRCSKIVFISQGIAQDAVEASLSVFNGLAEATPAIANSGNLSNLNNLGNSGYLD